MSNVALSFLKANLGFFDTPLDTAMESFLESRLQVADHQLREICKIQLADGSIADEDLKAMYAAWLYRKSVTGEPKPPMLQQAIRNRQIAQQILEKSL